MCITWASGASWTLVRAIGLTGTINVPGRSGHVPWEDVGVGCVYDFGDAGIGVAGAPGARQRVLLGRRRVWGALVIVNASHPIAWHSNPGIPGNVYQL